MRDVKLWYVVEICLYKIVDVYGRLEFDLRLLDICEGSGIV